MSRKVVAFFLAITMFFASVPMEGVASALDEPNQKTDVMRENEEENQTVSGNLENDNLDIVITETEDLEEDTTDEGNMDSLDEDSVSLNGMVVSGMLRSTVASTNYPILQSGYKLSEEQLFMQAPKYLNNKVMDEAIGKCWTYANSAMDDASGSTGIAAIMEGLKNGIKWIGKELGSQLGITDSNYDKFSKELALEVVKEYVNIDGSLLSNTKEIASVIGDVNFAYKMDDAIGRAEFSQMIKNKSKFWMDNQFCEEVVDSTWSKISKNTNAIKYLDKGVEGVVIVFSMMEMYELQVSAIDDLIATQAVGTELYNALLEVRKDLVSNPVTYILNNYCVDKVINKIGDKIIEIGGTEILNISKTATLLVSVGVEVIVGIYEELQPTAKDIIYATMMYNFVRESDNAVLKLQTKFIKGIGTVDEIEKYKVAYNFNCVALRIWMKKSKNCTSNINKINNLSRWGGLDYDKYLRYCLSEATYDINKGTLSISGSNTVYKTDNGTIIDENYSSTESIAAKFATIQSQFIPNGGQTWTGNWGGAIQCFGFARMVFSKLYGCEMPACYMANARYQLL